MSFFNKIMDWLGFGEAPTKDSMPLDQIQEAMEMARLAKRTEEYERALVSLDRAMHLADEQKDTHSVTVIALHQADILILQEKYDEAEQLLQTVQQTAEAVNQRGFISYALTSLGTLYQRQGHWEKARETYEQAREIAEEANSPGAEGRAIGYLADVYLHENNSSYAIHLLQESLPKLNVAGDLELSSYFVGRLGEAMIASGQENEGRQLLDRGLRLGEQLRDRTMVRRWSIALGKVAMEQSKYDEAYTFFKNALALFIAIPTDDYIDVLVNTSKVCLNMGQKEEALVYAQQALQVTENSENTSLKAVAEGAMGTALRANERDQEAITHLEKAVHALSANQDEMYVNMLRTLAATQIETGQVESATENYQKARKIAEDQELRIPLATIIRDMGLLRLRKHELSEAIQEWTEALVIFESEHDYNQMARLYCDIASTRRRLGMGARAIRDYEQSLMTLNNVDDLATRGIVLSNAANAYADQGDIESAGSFFKESIDIAEKIQDSTSLSTRLGNYGWFLTAIGEPRKAIEHLTRAIIISKEHGLLLQQAVQTDNLGLGYDVLSQYKTALTYHEEALSLIDGQDDIPPRWRAMFLANTARTKLSLGRGDEAGEMLDEALAIARTLIDFEVLAGVLIGKARVLLSEAHAEEAIPLIEESIQIGRRADMRRILADALALQSESESALGKEDDARQTWEEAKKIYKMVGAPQARQTPFWLGTNPPKEETPDT